jgi:CBS domain-containing protein
MEALVDSIMSKKPEGVGLELTVTKAASILADREDRCLIVTKNDFVLGIVTSSDMVEKVIAAGANPDKVFLSDIMTTPVITVPVTATIAKAAELMSEYCVARLPIVDESGALAGLVTSVELARWLAKLNDFQDPALNALAKLKKGGEGGPYR